MKNGKITIFLSHSHRDQEKVRKIRNILESLECEPLIFFLKCLDDKNTELEQFIKEEIEARNIFVYCKSSNAENSEWVQKELEYIKSFDKNRLYTIDIENDFSLSLISFLQAIAQILKRNRIFISHSNRDKQTVEALTAHLEKNGYQVQDPYRIRLGSNWSSQIRDTIDKAVREGVYMFVISPSSVNSPACMMELDYAIEVQRNKKGTIFPIIIDDGSDTDIWTKLPYYFQDRTALVIHTQPTEAELNRLTQCLNKLTADMI